MTLLLLGGALVCAYLAGMWIERYHCECDQ